MVNRVCVVGGATLDQYFSVKSWPAAGDKALISSLSRAVGGTTLNAAAVAASLGLPAALLEIMDTESDDGRFLVEGCRSFSLDCSHIISDRDTVNPRALVFLLPSGERSIFIETARRRDSSRIALWEPLILDSAFLYSMSATLSEFENAEATVRRAREAGVTVVLDCDASYDDERETALTRLATYPIFNRFSYEVFSGKTGSDAARQLLKSGATAVLETRDSEGIRVYEKGKTTDIRGITVPVADTTGAGDTMGGAFVFALSRGKSPVEASRYANFAAARCVTAIGATAGVCSEAELLEFISNHQAEVSDIWS